jgi:hypothetical protein
VKRCLFGKRSRKGEAFPVFDAIAKEPRVDDARVEDTVRLEPESAR